MVIIAPFDGSALSKTALLHAVQSSELYDETPLAVTIIPSRNVSYARKKGWIASDEGFDKQTILSRLRGQVMDVAPKARFEHLVVDKYAQSGSISNRLRRFARTRNTSAIFIGSGKAGRSFLGNDSVGGRLVFEYAYDVAIIRNPLPEFKSG
jgi:nucleotide-binding universal stress UspA family protein